ncbi:hypothetical protein [Spiroplasma endosymbiont of Amphimallon solstitiale]|uniref:hypothetical protein n=1 Tax=Spiroplasma endosymbiont of Amphimallon solstitiale TaxID=3066288 RepID=UPI00313BF3D1
MKKEIMINKKRIDWFLGAIIDIVIIEIAEKYLDLLKKDKGKDVPELILNYLDKSVILTKKNIKIKKYKNKINDFSEKEINDIHIFLEKNTKYKNLFEELNFIFNFIKNEDLQIDVFNYWYNNFFLDWKNNEFKKNREQQINNNSIINKFITKYKTNNNYLTINNT